MGYMKTLWEEKANFVIFVDEEDTYKTMDKLTEVIGHDGNYFILKPGVIGLSYPNIEEHINKIKYGNYYYEFLLKRLLKVDNCKVCYIGESEL